MPVTRVPTDEVVGISSAEPEKLLVPYKCAPGNIVHPPYEPQPVQNFYIDRTSGPVFVDSGISPNYYVDESQNLFFGGGPGSQGGSQAKPQKEVQVQIQKEVGQQNCAVMAQQIWHAVWDAMPGVFAQLISPIENRNASVLPQILKEMNRAENILNERNVIDVRQAVIDKLDAKKIDVNQIGAGGKPVPNGWIAQVNGANAPGVGAWFVAIGDAAVPVVNIFVNNLFIYVTLNIVSTSATAFTVSRDGTNYILQVDCSTASAETGAKVTGAAAGSGVVIAAISSGTNEDLILDGKNTGKTRLAVNSTGNVQINRALEYGGVTLSYAVTGTGNMVLSASPTITGHPTIEGVTSTGATGTGNLVFSASPTMTGTLICDGLTATGTLNLANLDFTFISSIQYDTATNKIQYKTTTVTNGVVGAESGSWTDLTAGGTMTTQSVVTDVNYNSGTGVLKQTKSTLTVFEKTSDGDSTIDTAEAC